MNFIDAMIAQFGDLESAIDFWSSRQREQPVDARLNLQVLLNLVGREPEAFEKSTEMLRIAPTDPRVLFNRGWHLIRRLDFERGFALLENGRALNTYGHPPLNSNQPLFDSRLHRGQSVILVGEGGIGDEIINLRWARTLAREYGCKVVVACQPSLAPIVARMPEVAAAIQREAAPGVYHRAWMPAMSGVHRLGLGPDALGREPYLSVDPERAEAWGAFFDRERVAKGARPLRIGVRWAGNPQFEHQQFRKFPPDTILSLRDVPGVRVYSFQRDNDLVRLPPDVVDLGPRLRDWDDTAAALGAMDIVISSCTSVAHMSAALGRQTWVVTPVLPYYVWATPGDTSTWYESVRLFRQARYGVWSDVTTRLRDALGQEVARRQSTAWLQEPAP